MGDFRTFKTAKRVPAVPHEPVVDPAGWDPDELRDTERWTYHLTESDSEELIAGVKAARRNGIGDADMSPDTFPLEGFAEALEDIRCELADGRGAIRIQGFPIDRFDMEETVTAYLGLGSYLGTLEPQNKFGHLIGHVKDFSAVAQEKESRGYNTNISSSFHCDSTDYVGLMCFQEPKSGGNSQIASTVTIYNRFLSERPDLVACLMESFYKSRYSEQREGESPYYKCPVFAFVDGYISSTGFGRGFMQTQGQPGVPDFTKEQLDAIPVFERLAEECSIEMPFVRGDIQIVNNYVVVHSRRQFEDSPETGKCRHLMRLWLNDRNGRPIHEDRLERRNRGLYLKDVVFNVPVDLKEPVPV